MEALVGYATAFKGGHDPPDLPLPHLVIDSHTDVAQTADIAFAALMKSPILHLLAPYFLQDGSSTGLLGQNSAGAVCTAVNLAFVTRSMCQESAVKGVLDLVFTLSSRVLRNGQCQAGYRYNGSVAFLGLTLHHVPAAFLDSNLPRPGVMSHFLSNPQEATADVDILFRLLLAGGDCEEGKEGVCEKKARGENRVQGSGERGEWTMEKKGGKEDRAAARNREVLFIFDSRNSETAMSVLSLLQHRLSFSTAASFPLSPLPSMTAGMEMGNEVAGLDSMVLLTRPLTIISIPGSTTSTNKAIFATDVHANNANAVHGYACCVKLCVWNRNRLLQAVTRSSVFLEALSALPSTMDSISLIPTTSSSLLYPPQPEERAMGLSEYGWDSFGPGASSDEGDGQDGGKRGRCETGEIAPSGCPMRTSGSINNTDCHFIQNNCSPMNSNNPSNKNPSNYDHSNYNHNNYDHSNSHRNGNSNNSFNRIIINYGSNNSNDHSYNIGISASPNLSSTPVSTSSSSQAPVLNPGVLSSTPLPRSLNANLSLNLDNASFVVVSDRTAVKDAASAIALVLKQKLPTSPSNSSNANLIYDKSGYAMDYHNNNSNNNNICNVTAPFSAPIHRSFTAPVAANSSNIAFMDDTSLKRDFLLTSQGVFDPVPKNFQIHNGILSSQSPGARQDDIIYVDSPCKTIDLNQASLGLNRLTISNTLIDTDRSSCNDACNANNKNNSSSNSNSYNRNSNHTNERCIMNNIINADNRHQHMDLVNGIISHALQGTCPVYTKSRSRDFTSVVSVAVKAIASAFDSVVVESSGEEIGFQPFIRRDGLNPSKAPINVGDNANRAVDRDRDSKGATLFRTLTFPESAYPTSNPSTTSFTSFPPPYPSSAPLAPSIPPSMKPHHVPSVPFSSLSPLASNDLLPPNFSPSLASPPSSYASRFGLLNGTGSFLSPLDALEDPICPQQLKFSSAMSSYTTSPPSPSHPPPLSSSATQGTVLEHPRVESSLPLFPVSSTIGGVGMKGFEQIISLEQMVCRENSIINAGNFVNCSSGSSNNSSSSSSSNIINNLLLGGGGMTNSDVLCRTYPMTTNSSISSNPSIAHNPSISSAASSAAAVAKPYGGGLSKDLKQLEMSFFVTKFPSFGQLLPSKTSPVKVTAHSRPGVITNILVKLLTEHQNITLITAGGDALHVAMVAVIAARYRLKESKGIQIILIPKIITVDTLSTLGWGSVFLKFEIIRWDAVNRRPSQ